MTTHVSDTPECTRQPGPVTLDAFQKTPGLIMRNPRQKRLLCIHSTGAGKTCTMVEIINQFLTVDADGVLQISDRISGVTMMFPSKDLYGNLAKAVVKDCPGVLNSWVERNRNGRDDIEMQAWVLKHMFFKRGSPISEIRTQDIEKSKHAIEWYPPTTAMGRLVKQFDVEKTWFGGGEDGKPRLIVMDEVHNVVNAMNALPQQQTQLMAMQPALIELAKNQDIIIVGLTATPALEGPVDFARLVNFIRGGIVLNEADFEENSTYTSNTVSEADARRLFKEISGYFVYYDVTSDTHRFPSSNDRKFFYSTSPAMVKPFMIYSRMNPQVWYGWADTKYENYLKVQKQMEFIEQRVRPSFDLTRLEKDMLRSWGLPPSRPILRDIVTVIEHGDTSQYNIRYDAVRNLVNRQIDPEIRTTYKRLFNATLPEYETDMNNLPELSGFGTKKANKSSQVARWEKFIADPLAADKKLRERVKNWSSTRPSFFTTGFNGNNYKTWSKDDLRKYDEKVYNLLYDERIGLVHWKLGRGKIMVYSDDKSAKNTVKYIRAHLTDTFVEITANSQKKIMWNEQGDKIPFIEASKDISVPEWAILLSRFNDRDSVAGDSISNCCGQIIAIIFITDKRKAEGTDYTSLREVHLLSGILMHSWYKQIVGRAVRFCSHGCYISNTTCNRGGRDRWWNVLIYKHFTQSPEGEDIYDAYADRVARKTRMIDERLMAFIAAASLDCAITSPRTRKPCGEENLLKYLSNMENSFV